MVLQELLQTLFRKCAQSLFISRNNQNMSHNNLENSNEPIAR